MYEVYKWCMRLNDNENKICWMRDYQRWHTIHIQIIMIRYRMRWIVDSLSWWIGVQLIIMHSILHQQSNNHFNLSPCIHILYEWCIIQYLHIILLSTYHPIRHHNSHCSHHSTLSSSIMNNKMMWITHRWLKRMNDKIDPIHYQQTRSIH